MLDGFLLSMSLSKTRIVLAVFCCMTVADEECVFYVRITPLFFSVPRLRFSPMSDHLVRKGRDCHCVCVCLVCVCVCVRVCGPFCTDKKRILFFFCSCLPYLLCPTLLVWLLAMAAGEKGQK